MLDHTEDVALALDLTQNVFLKFWTLRDQYHLIENVRAYLMQMAKNAFLDACRQDKSRMVYLQTMCDGAETCKNLTEILLDERELQRIFQQAIIDLFKQRRVVFVLSKIEDLPREKVATTLGISPFTEKVTLKNALRKIREKCTSCSQFQLTNKIK